MSIISKIFLIIFAILLSENAQSQTPPLPYLNNVKLKVEVRQEANNEYYFYHYTIYNGIESQGKITDFEIDISSSPQKVQFDTTSLKFKDALTKNFFYSTYPLVEVPIVEVGFPDFPKYEDAGLSVNGTAAFSTSLVEPNTKQGGFILMSKGLPGIRKFIASPQYDPNDFYQSVDEVESIEEIRRIDSLVNRDYRELPFRGQTIGPVAPLKNFVPNDFLDSLQNYLAFSCDATWIANKGICNSLDKKLQNVHKQLDKGNQKQAGNVLGAFLNEVEAQKGKKISSEAYTLLFFNGQYLLERL